MGEKEVAPPADAKKSREAPACTVIPQTLSTFIGFSLTHRMPKAFPHFWFGMRGISTSGFMTGLDLVPTPSLCEWRAILSKPED